MMISTQLGFSDFVGSTQQFASLLLIHNLIGGWRSSQHQVVTLVVSVTVQHS